MPGWRVPGAMRSVPADGPSDDADVAVDHCLPATDPRDGAAYRKWDIS